MIASSPYDRNKTSSIAADVSLNTVRTDVHAPPESFDPETRERHCAELMDRFGFWSQEQCTLWNLIETNATIDMTPYLASNIEGKWWSPTTPSDPPGSGPNGRIIYHLHLHKAAGTSFCSWFKEARQLTGNRTSRRPTTNPKNNCNVPTEWWMDKNKPQHGFISIWSIHWCIAGADEVHLRQHKAKGLDIRGERRVVRRTTNIWTDRPILLHHDPTRSFRVGGIHVAVLQH